MADPIDDRESSKSSTLSEAPRVDGAPTSERAEHYRVNVGGEKIVVMSTLEVLEALKAGRITGTALVWKQGMSDWTELRRVPALALLMPSPPKMPSLEHFPPKSDPPSAPSASAPPLAPDQAPTNQASTWIKTPSGARRVALPRTPVPRADLSAVRSTSPPVPRPSRPSLHSLPPGTLSPLASRPSHPRPSLLSIPPRDDDDDDGVTQVLSNAKLLQDLRDARQKAHAVPPPAPDKEGEKALAVYERPVATLAFAEQTDNEGPTARPAAVAPAVSSLPPKVVPRVPPPPSRTSSLPPLPAPPARARQPSLPTVVVSPEPPPAAAAAPAPAPDSLEPVVARGPAPTMPPQEYTVVAQRRRWFSNRHLVMACAGSALLASVVTAVVVNRPAPTPLVVAPAASPEVSAPAEPARALERALEPPPEEALPAVPILALSALPKAPPPVARPKADVPVSSTPDQSSEPAESAKASTEKSLPVTNPYKVELEDEEPAPVAPDKPALGSPPPSTVPAWLEEGLR